MRNTLAIIPARGGSKRIKNKNIKLFNKKPIIFYSINAAKKSNLFKEIMVSTDNDKIAQVAKKYGAKIPFYRSKKNSGDFSIIADVIEEVIKKYKREKIDFEYICCIYATAPLINEIYIKKAYNYLIKYKYDTVISVAQFDYPIQRSLTIKNKRLIFQWPNNYKKRSQDLKKFYHDAGQFFWIKTSNFLKNKKIFNNNTYPLIIPSLDVQDIDTLEDWKIAELKYKLLQEK